MADWLAILKAYVDTLETIVGTEGGVALANKLTAARAALLDQITALRLAELDAANIPTDLANIIAYVDLIDDAVNGLAAIKAEVEGLAGAAMRGTDGAALAASWTAALATALGNYTAARAGYLDNINQAGLLQLTAARAALLDQITALRMAELDAANIPTDLANIIAYVDLIDDVTNGLAAIKAEVEGLAGAAMRGTDGAALAASWTAALATALGNYTAARAGYLDNINQAGLLQVTAARAALLDQITALRMAELDAANIPTDLANIIAYVDLIDDAASGLAAIKAEVEGLAGAAMRGTDNAALAVTALSTVTWTAALAAELEATAKGKLQIKATTKDLNLAADTYDLFTATTQDVVVEKLVLRMPNSALAAPFTYLTIQTDDTTPIVLIDATAGAVGNLTAEAQLAWTGAILLDAGTGAKIRLTIAFAFGGAATVADVIAEYRAVVAGGLLT